MLQRERAENQHHLLQNCHQNEKRESGLRCSLDITPVHMSLDPSLCAVFLAETAGGSFRCLRRNLRDDCPTKAFLSGEFFPECVNLVLSQRALLSMTRAARRRGSFIPERRHAS